MIDWTQIDTSSSADWVALAQRLIGQAQTYLTMPQPDRDALASVHRDFAEYVGQANLDCPPSAIKAIERASTQITRSFTALTIDDLERREERLDAVKARMSSAANELKADAAALQLKPVQDALVTANKLAAELKALATNVQSLTKAEIPDKINAVAKHANKIVRELESSIPD